MTDVLAALAQVAVLVFVVTSMIALGLSLTVRQVVAPLRDLRLVLLGLATSFLVAPAAAWGIAALFGLSQDQTLGLLLLGVAAGAPFLPKLAQMAHGDVPYSVGLMVLLMVVTVGYVPLVLPLLVDGVAVDAWDIARPLLLLMLLPLAIALAVRARYPDAARLAPALNTVSTTALALGIGVAVLVALPQIWDQVGTGVLLATLVLTAVCLAAGYLLGGSGREQRTVTALGTAQRNLSAALLIAGTSFADSPQVLVTVMVAALLLTASLLLVAAEAGRRAPSERGVRSR
ncbi:BASS family bile acid:Na+ symporter [Isoptericola sp. CG 20/1183]|uniref:BASS family bile acid:Na+ symporter n=1 Tax=Isoptericola halotolerans TaxID=300560 RepID=A0ABX5ED74_9MICO|nr:MULTISPECIES: bile acid:sodium symporter [Isoptericola]PRZ05751.1 BASS family bile acid:Na+ symporter [Isoptericola halotolerans]PRZ06319.1 BASS family bile acid:Na+ symporter [Isoptericola sp. CG 20/1183]